MFRNTLKSLQVHSSFFKITKRSLHTIEACIPDPKKIARLNSYQEEKNNNLLKIPDNYSMPRIKFNNIVYVMTRQSPQSAVHEGGLLSKYSLSLTADENMMTPSLLPQVPCLALPKIPDFTCYHLFAVPIKGSYLMLPNSRAEIYMNVIPFNNWWLSREIMGIKSNNVLIFGPNLNGFYDFNCTARGECFDNFLLGQLIKPKNVSTAIPHTDYTLKLKQEVEDHYNQLQFPKRKYFS